MDLIANYAKPWVTRLLMSFIGAYVENLSSEQLDVGVGKGEVDLRDLRLKKSALDKLGLPFEVVEGRIGKFLLKMNWSVTAMANTPLQVEIEDVQVLIAASSTTEYSREDEEKREQQLKNEMLERAEALRVGEPTEQVSYTQSLINSIIARIVNNAQISIKNVHLRYEDKQTVPEHPFAAGFTLAHLSAISTDENWKPSYLDGKAQSIHKLSHLDSFAVYFNTDCESMSGLSYKESKKLFRDQISSEAHPVEHQYILKPVSGEGRIILNKTWGKDNQPHYDAHLLFNELGFTLDNHQYRDVISLADEYHIYARQHKYRKYRPDDAEFAENKPAALWKFATTAIRDEIHDKNQRWTWEHFRMRRDDRHRYVDLFKEKELANKNEMDDELKALERRLSYNDIRFYRSIARSQLKKDKDAFRRMTENKKKQQSWGSWLWSSPTETEPKSIDTLSDEEKKGLYEMLDYDEKSELVESFETPRESIKTRLQMQLKQGSLRLKSSPHDGSNDIVSLVFDSFEMGGVQRRDNFEMSLSLGNFRVFDGTTTNTLYNQIVHVKDSGEIGSSSDQFGPSQEPFFSMKYEYQPLDGRADNGLTVYLRSMEIIYQRGYVEAVVAFFRPPESQLQSVEALLNVAGETLEGIQKETRAGLEYALETHKTVDLRLDMHAPIIIIPESITQEHCYHMVIDAGRVLVESTLADKTALREIEKKRNHKYTDEDYKQLESMMYDNYSVKLIAAQFVIGKSLDACRTALHSEQPDPKLHLLERVNIDLLAQNSIVPSARSIARLRMSGRLPNLHVNFSDSKYKTLMRLIDVTLPRLGDGSDKAAAPQTQRKIRAPADLQPSSGLFGIGQLEYIVDDGIDGESSDAKSEVSVKTLVEPTDTSRQHQFELSFQVDSLQATMLRSMEDGSEQELANLQIDGFLLKFALAKFEMKVDVDLRAINVTSLLPGLDPLHLVSTESSEDAKLMNVVYRRVQRASSDFVAVYGGYDQSVEVKLSTFIFRAVPEHVLPLYDYIMSTFVPNRSSDTVQRPGDLPQDDGTGPIEQSNTQQSGDKIRVRANLASFQICLMDVGVGVATLSLSTANVEVFLTDGNINVTAKLGDLLLTDDSPLQTMSSKFKQLLSIEGDDLLELRYEAFGADEAAHKGVNSSVNMTAGSLKFHFLDGPLNSIYLFLLKFARLKGLYDAATEAAVQQASKVEGMAFQLNISSPIVVFPVDPAHLEDVFTLKLGKLLAQNRFEHPSQHISATLNGLQLTSMFCVDDVSHLKIVDDLNISMNATQTGDVSHLGVETPEFKIVVDISDVNIQLTQLQYCRLVALAQTMPSVFAGAPQEGEEPQIKLAETTPALSASPSVSKDVEIDLLPELSPSFYSSGQLALKKVDLTVKMPLVKLHLYDVNANDEANLKQHGIARFALRNSTMTLDLRTNGALQSQLWINAFTMTNTKPGLSKYREIIPATEHGRDQFHCLFSMSGGLDSASQLVMTVDSPQIIFSVDPVFALSNFFLGAFGSQTSMSEKPEQTAEDTIRQPGTDGSNRSQYNFRFDLHDASVSILEDDQEADSQAIRLSLSQLSLSQQNAIVLEITRLGMSLTRMGKQADAVRFLDDVDMKMSSESRSESNRQFTGVNIAVEQEFVFRTSYRDILLITSIANKAIALFSNSEGKESESKQAAFDNATNAVASRGRIIEGKRSSSDVSIQASNRSKASLDAKVIMTTEELNATMQGFRLVLIGDFHEAPMLHLKAKTFSVSVTDWSRKLHATTMIPLTIDYWNLKNSHWEPLIDPWSFTVAMRRDALSGNISLKLSSKELLDINVSSSFAELAISTANVWSKEGDRVLQRARGSYAPYRIHNRTGGSVFIWSDVNGSANASSFSAVKIDQDAVVDWRFDDWKKMREDGTSSSTNSIGVRFDGKPWEHLRSVPVDREGEYIYSLRPQTKLGISKLMCEIVIKDNVKIVTLRSTYKVENQTFYPLEITLVDNTGHPVYPIEKIAPGQDFALPIEAVSQNKIRIQPDPGFGYRWSPSIWWEDLREVRRIGGLSIRCPHVDRKEAPFHFTLWPVWSSHTKDYPQLKLNLRAPIELENLLPFDISYKVYDKDTGHNWDSYLRKGGNTPVHSVDLNHLVLLSVSIQDSVFKPSDFTIINADRKFEFDQENQLTLADAQGRKCVLMLNYVKFPDAGGAFKVQIYSPYIVLNKTGLPFGVKAARSAGIYKDVAGVTTQDELSRSTPFLLSHCNKKGNEFIFRVGESTWSQTIRFDAPSAEMAMVVPHRSQKSEINVGLSWSEGTGKYKLSKVIELTLRFCVYNKLSQAVLFREVGAPPGRAELLSGERSSLQFMRTDERKLLTVAYPGLNALWSPAIEMEAIGSVHTRMRQTGSTSRQDTHLIVADVILDKATIFIVLSPHDGPWPFVIENKSDYDVTFGQIDESRDKPESEIIYSVKPGKRLPYAWDFPAMEKKKIYLSCNKRSRKIDIMEIGVLLPLKHNSGALSLDVRADGPSQLLSISNYREETSLYKPKRRGTVSRSDSISTTQEFEAVQEEVPPSLAVDLDLKGLGISLLNKKLVEILYFSIQSLKLEYSNSPVAQAVNLSFGTLQVDNQLHDAFFPVLLQPTPISKEARSLGALPTVQASVIILNDSAHGVLFVKYASILLQAITVQIDEAFLYAVLDLTKLEGVNWETESESVLIRNDDEGLEPTSKNNGQDVYFEVLELQPIILSVSFVRNITPSDDDSQAMTTRNPLAIALNILTMTLANAEGVELQLNALGLTDVRLTLPDIQSRIMYHYRQEVLRQIYRVLGSADFLGNPVGLFSNVSSGVADIFYEPWHGVVQHGGGELGVGIAKGAASFVKKTIFGVSDSMTKVTSSLGKGLSAATLDADYQAKRRMNQRRNRPRHALVGVSAGAEAFANSVASGVEGMKPIEGADAEGAFGFFKGMGKGIVGAVTKPVVGVFDLAANVTEGIRNTTTVFDAPQRDRVRKPRHIPADGVLQPYSSRRALGQSWMRDLQDGKYRKEYYISHIDLPGTDNVILLTNGRIISFSSRELRLQWDLSLTSVAGVQGEHTGIRFASKAGRDHDKFVIIQDNGSKDWFFEEVKAVVMAFNARRRLER
ncbi:vacuolar protein sorting-associated protein vps13 [Phellopilus nigrolimitatus]|nr:vacuolar protein sorting-associated protein vps13 [Phellopilus nigrolimitatus]